MIMNMSDPREEEALRDILNQPQQAREKQSSYFTGRKFEALDRRGEHEEGFTNRAIVQELFQKHQKNIGILDRIRAEQHKNRQQREDHPQNMREEGSVQVLQPVDNREVKFSREQKKQKKKQYPVYGSMIERSQVWLKEKKRRATERRQESMLSDLNQCTFSPTLPARKTSQIYLKSKSRGRHSQPVSKPVEQITPTGDSGVHRDISMGQYHSAKKQLNRRLFSVRY